MGVDGAVTLAMVGDVFVVERLADDDAAGSVNSILRAADAVFGNLEGPVSHRGTPAEKWINMRISPDHLSDLRKAGFNVMAIANNHIMDFGLEAFSDTLTLLAECDIAPVGGGDNLEEAWTPVIRTWNGVKVAFLAAASTLPPGCAAGQNRPGIAPIHVAESYRVDTSVSSEQPGSAPYVHTWAWPEDVEAAQIAVQRAKDEADFVIFAMHWGVPPLWRSRFQDGLAEYQRPVGRAIIDAGADVVVGHHPHSLQGVEMYRGKPIFYSLGNCIFHKLDMKRNRVENIIARNTPYEVSGSYDRQWAESMIVEIRLVEGGSACYIIHAVLLDEAGNPHLLRGDEARAVIERLEEMSAPLGGQVELQGDQGRVIV